MLISIITPCRALIIRFLEYRAAFARSHFTSAMRCQDMAARCRRAEPSGSANFDGSPLASAL